MSKRVAVVLPAFNEALGLEKLLWRIARALDALDYEIIVVDDGSTDETVRIAESLADRLPLRILRHDVNSGYGAGIRTGLLDGRERADVVVTMDADDSHDPALIPLMLQGIACGSDVIVASRFVPGGREVGVPFRRRVLSHGAGLVFGRLLHIRGIHDYTSGYRAYRSGFLDELIASYGEDAVVREMGFTVGVELLLKADRVGGTLAEVPLVLRYDRKRSESKLRLGKTMADYWRLFRRLPEERAGSQRRQAGTVRERLRRRARVAATLATDLGAVFVAFAASFLALGGLGTDWQLVTGAAPSVTTYGLLAALYASCATFSLWRMGLYASRLAQPALGHLQRVIESLGMATAIYFTTLFLSGVSLSPRLQVYAPALLAVVTVFLARRGLAAGRLARREQVWTAGSRALVYGAGDTGRLLAKQVAAAPMLDGGVVGFLDDELPVGTVVGDRESRIPLARAALRVLGSREDLARVAAETQADELYVTELDSRDRRLEAVRADTERLGLRLSVVPRIGVAAVDRLESDDLGAVPILRVRPYTPNRLFEASKRVMDLVIVALLTPVAIPVALITAAAVAIDGRPILFRQIRIGRAGRPFTVWKFRSMDLGCEPYADSPRSDADPRITRIGRLVRMAGIDELPQLINVVRGEMSLVGPRPEMPQIAAGYGPVERQRLSVRPGITGTWQLSPDRAGAIHESLEHDLYYLRQQNLFFDLLIVVETALFALRAAARSLGAFVTELARGWQQADRSSSPVSPGVASSGAYVLVALDQRRRPDEPASWSELIPRAASLAIDCPVKLVVAEMNNGRMRELSRPNGHHRNSDDATTDSPETRDLEYVGYESPDGLHNLAGAASVVVTDLGFVADRASERGVAVVEVADGGLRCRGMDEVARRPVHAERVLAAFRGPDNALRYAQ